MNAAELLAAKNLREAVVRVATDDGPADLHLRAMGRKAYRLLVEEHPSEVADEVWNRDTFPPALIAASVVEPEFTLEQAQQLWDEWEPGDADFLFLQCYRLNERPSGVGFISPGSVRTDGSGLNSTTAPLEGSPTPPS